MLKIPDSVNRIMSRVPPHSVGLNLFFSTMFLTMGLSRQRQLKVTHQVPVGEEAIRQHWIAKDGEHNFLKDVLGDEALGWVKQRNEHSIAQLGDPSESPLYDKVLSILDSSDKIPYLKKINDLYYNFWQDKANPRGLWRRISLDSYLSTSPNWEVVIDFDELGRAEGESWVYKGHTLYEPSPSSPHQYKEKKEVERAMMHLSRGGADAVVLREFDLVKKAFVEQDPFYVPEAKSSVVWKTQDILLVGTDLKDGKSLTDSGYPRVTREWHRGTALSESTIVHEGEVTDVAVHMSITKHRHHSYTLRSRSITFYTSKNELFLPRENRWVELGVPLDAEVSVYSDQLLVLLRSKWDIGNGSVFEQGSLVVTSIQDFVHRSSEASFTVLFKPTKSVSLDSFATTKNYLILSTLDTVKSRFVFWRYHDPADSCGDNKGNNQNSGWELCGAENCASVRGAWLSAVDSNESNEYWLTSSSFLQPTTLLIGNAEEGPDGVSQAKPVKALPAQFNADGLMETQYLATSADGTKVPYFLVSSKDIPMDGSTPTLLYGYGGFEISLPPAYSAVVGAGWLDTSNGGSSGGCKHRCFVMANIRGGGEFGPAWHQAALRENRNKAYDDFIAVAEDLIKRGVTSPSKLGIRGGSNGGLLMGNMIVRRPDLFGAVCCAVPLLDMRCYSTLLAGASWMAEYGNPDLPEDWAFLQKYSAYHNINPAQVAAGQYPALLMTTSTRDDRVHPYHARCFVRRLLDCTKQSPAAGQQSAQDKILYYENIEGGHGGAADNKQQAFMNVLYLNFLKRVLQAE